MTATYTQAVDAMFALFKQAWDAGAATIVGSAPAIYWQGVEPVSGPPSDVYWCRVSTQNVMEKQATLGDPSGVGKHRYTAMGLVFVQVFCPMTDAQATDKGRRLAELARNAFRGKEATGGVWFRNVRINELPPEEDLYRFNIVAEYQFDDVG